MSSATGSIGNVTSNTALVEMAMAYSRSRIVCAAARLGIADALAGGERSIDDLAKACSADSGSLYRLLRALAILGITSETSPRKFVLTPLGEPLRKDAPNSVWPAVVFWADLLSDSWVYLTDCVRAGQRSFQVMESQGIASRWSKDPDAPAIFRAVMGTAPAEDYLPIAQAWDFSGRRVVADLGGGGGALLSAILKNDPKLTGMLVDRKESIDAAAPRLAEDGLAARCKLIAADLLESVPPGADELRVRAGSWWMRECATVCRWKGWASAQPQNDRAKRVPLCRFTCSMYCVFFRLPWATITHFSGQGADPCRPQPAASAT